LNTEKAATRNAFTAYLKVRCRLIGFPEVTTFMVLRKGSANNLVTSVGTELAREVVTHDVQSSKHGT
jgi:hypothetical protein